MNALPELLSESVGDRVVIETVAIGGGDAVTVTPETTHVYRSDGLLSDESVETFDHDAERLSVRTKRRKSEIRLVTMDGEGSFTVPEKVADRIVEAMVEGVLRTTGVIGDEEELLALFRFSELTLVVTDERLFEHVGSAVWDEDFETVDYAELTGLDFEKGSVATQVVLETEDRRRRVKVPNEHAGSVRRAIQESVFGFHDVASLEELRSRLAVAEPSPEAEGDADSGIEDGSRTASDDANRDTDSDSFSTDWISAADGDSPTPVAQNANVGAEGDESPDTGSPDSDERSPTNGSTTPELDELAEQVGSLSEQVEKQTELIESQRELIEQLVEELRRGR